MSHPVLSSEEIAALMDGFGAAPGDAEAVHGHVGIRPAQHALPRLTNHPWSELDAVDGRFSVLLAMRLSQQSGRRLGVVSEPVVVQAHERLVGQLAAMHVACCARLAGSGCSMLTVLDEEGVRRYADLIFGGGGLGPTAPSAGLSCIEQSVARGLMRDAFQAYADVWGRTLESVPMTAPVHQTGGAMGFAPAWTRMVGVQFRITAGATLATLVVAMPAEQVRRLLGKEGARSRVSRRIHARPMQERDHIAAHDPQGGAPPRSGGSFQSAPRVRVLRSARASASPDSRQVRKLAWSRGDA